MADFVPLTKDQIAAQLQLLRKTGFDLKLASQAGANGFAPEFFFAIASRETNCVNKLGDVQGGVAHGVGIVQIDIQHPINLAAIPYSEVLQLARAHFPKQRLHCRTFNFRLEPPILSDLEHEIDDSCSEKAGTQKCRPIFVIVPCHVCPSRPDHLYSQVINPNAIQQRYACNDCETPGTEETSIIAEVE